MSSKIKFQFVNVAASGGTREIAVEEGTTIEKFLASELGPSVDLSTMMIRVNRREVTPRDYVITAGDRVTLTPTNISGA